MAKYYCILFDADNTLLDFDAAENKALAETLVEYGIEPDAGTVQTYRDINSELWRQLEKGQIRRDKLMGERFTRFLKAINAAGDGVEMNRCYLDHLSSHPDLMTPNVLDVLGELSEVATLAIMYRPEKMFSYVPETTILFHTRRHLTFCSILTEFFFKEKKPWEFVFSHD